MDAWSLVVLPGVLTCLSACVVLRIACVLYVLYVGYTAETQPGTSRRQRSIGYYVGYMSGKVSCALTG